MQPDKLCPVGKMMSVSFALRNNDFQGSNCCGVKELILAKFFFKAAFAVLENSPLVHCVFRSAIDTNVQHYPIM